LTTVKKGLSSHHFKKPVGVLTLFNFVNKLVSKIPYTIRTLIAFSATWFVFINVAAFAGLFSGYVAGMLPYFVSDHTIPYAVPVALVFLFGLVFTVITYYKSLTTSISDFTSENFREEEKFKAWWNFRIKSIRWIGYLLIFLGLVGTILGFMAALSPESVDVASATDASSIKALLITLMSGTGIALQTTLLGSVFGGVWLEINAKLIENNVFKRWLADV